MIDERYEILKVRDIIASIWLLVKIGTPKHGNPKHRNTKKRNTGTHKLNEMHAFSVVK